MHPQKAGIPVQPTLSARLEALLASDDAATLSELRAELDDIHRGLVALETRVEHDALTGAFNRHGLRRLEQEVTARSLRLGTPVSALFIDIDRLKDLNRVHGHVATDGLLRAVALRLHDLSRPYDYLVRWGGDEFILLLPDVTRDKATLIADRIRRSIAETPFDRDGEKVMMSVSIGVGDLGTGEPVVDLIRRVSEMMYEAKFAGGNRVRVFDAPPEAAHLGPSATSSS
ncbi:GGDEF domain-containing protein [Amorphus sp. MBR-141]